MTDDLKTQAGNADAAVLRRQQELAGAEARMLIAKGRFEEARDYRENVFAQLQQDAAVAADLQQQILDAEGEDAGDIDPTESPAG